MLRMLTVLALAVGIAFPALAQDACQYNAGQLSKSDGSSVFMQCDQNGRLMVRPGALAYGGSASASVATSSGTLVTAGAYKVALQICTLPTSTSNVWLRPDGGTAAANTGVPVYAGGGCTTFGTMAQPMPTAAITAITDGSAAQTVTLSGG